MFWREISRIQQGMYSMCQHRNLFFSRILRDKSFLSQYLTNKIALHSLWYHHTYTCDDTRGCVMQFWPPDDEHMCSKHVEA